MPNKSISFNEEMLKAILDGRKTQTRRTHTEAKYQVGDIVYVKEPWQVIKCNEDGDIKIRYCADQKDRNTNIPEEYDPDSDVLTDYWIETCSDLIKAGTPTGDDGCFIDILEHPHPARVRSAEEMPEYFSRLSLKITNVKRERLITISTNDLIAEGIADSFSIVMVGNFRRLWNSIYGNDESKHWHSNPWVWVYEFEVSND